MKQKEKPRLSQYSYDQLTASQLQKKSFARWARRNLAHWSTQYSREATKRNNTSLFHKDLIRRVWKTSKNFPKWSGIGCTQKVFKTWTRCFWLPRCCLVEQTPQVDQRTEWSWSVQISFKNISFPWTFLLLIRNSTLLSLKKEVYKQTMMMMMMMMMKKRMMSTTVLLL